MTKLEKVIKALECRLDVNGSKFTHCLTCDYRHDVDHCQWTCQTDGILEDALALLKAQEPRVMTLEEVNALDWDYCYLEQERLPGKEYRGMLGKYIMTCVTWPSITAAKISQGMDNYGKTWRCWTARPTDAQREAVKWE